MKCPVPTAAEEASDIGTSIAKLLPALAKALTPVHNLLNTPVLVSLPFSSYFSNILDSLVNSSPSV